MFQLICKRFNSALIHLCNKLISHTHLTPCSPSSVLAPLLEPHVPVCSDDPIVQLSPTDVPHTPLSILTIVIPVCVCVCVCVGVGVCVGVCVCVRACLYPMHTMLTHSTKQNPQGVFLYLSSPMMTLFTSPHMENSSYSCSSDV